jgi:hypothetical protein
MRWHILHQGQVVGPYEEQQVIEAVRGGMVNVQVRGEAGGPWMPILQSPFAGHAPAQQDHVVEPAQQRPATKAKATSPLVWVGVAGMCLVWVVIIWAALRDEPGQPRLTPVPEVNASPVAAPAPAPKPPTLLDRLNESESLSAALTLLGPQFEDTVDKLDPAAVLLAHWSTTKLDWKALSAVPATTHGRVMKDSAAETTKRMCIAGSVIEIEVDRSLGAPMYRGGMFDGSLNVYRFIAVRSTGELTAQKPARFCGIVTGLQAYSNVSGGQTKAVHVVGLFDLAENRQPPK